MAIASKARSAPRALPPDAVVSAAIGRLARERALQTLLRGAVPTSVLRRLLRDAMPPRDAREAPEEVWAALAAGMAVESEVVSHPIAQALHDRLAWDREPSGDEEWDRLGHERPLEALWMAALSEDKAMRRNFPRRAAEWLAAYRASPACTPPSWEFVEGVLDVHSLAMRDVADLSKEADDLERKLEAERQRSDDLREELKRLRRETSELRAEKAQLERKASVREASAPSPEAGRLEEVERRLRKAEKESEHLRRELERARAVAAGEAAEEAPAPSSVLPFVPDAPIPEVDAASEMAPPSEDANPRRRVLRQMLKKLVKKGKIGASHTHEDNVYRGVADHEKGIAKELIDLLYREGLLMPKPTATDPHVSLNPERVAEVRRIVAGHVSNPRLHRYVSGAE
jgi:hypothetical protein